MGAVLSLSPGPQKAGFYDGRSGSLGHYPSFSSRGDGRSIFLPAMAWKRLVASTKRRKGGSKMAAATSLAHPLGSSIYQTDPLLQLNRDNARKSLSCANLCSYEAPAGPGPGPWPLSQAYGGGQLSSKKTLTSSPKRVIVQASTSELLRCLGQFLCCRCYRLKHLSPAEPHFFTQVFAELKSEGSLVLQDYSRLLDR